MKGLDLGLFSVSCDRVKPQEPENITGNLSKVDEQEVDAEKVIITAVFSLIVLPSWVGVTITFFRKVRSMFFVVT